ncbi:DUF2207 family protein [Evansella clarkii]|uniref:DUF2207 family protein n=1 Tax=Evansella clarkii TaxID=79879 RepID=UPI00099712FB|nr:DUF2207 domain-containing protein [Evansella clarkii]
MTTDFFEAGSAVYLFSLSLFFLLAAVIFLIGFKENIRRKKHKLESKKLLITEEDLEKLPPALAAQFLHGREDSSRHILSGLLSLVAKGKFHLGFDEKRGEYYFERDLSESGKLEEEEQFLADWFLEEIGKQSRFYPSQLEEYTETRENRERFIQRYYEWEENNEQKLKQLGLLSDLPPRKLLLGALALVQLVAGGILLFVVPFVSVLYLAGAIASFWLMFYLKNMTDYGWKIFYRFKEYKERLPETARNQTDLSQFPPAALYALAFGKKDDYFRHLPVKEAPPSLRQENFPLYFAAGSGVFALSSEEGDLADALTASIEKAVSPAYETAVEDGTGGFDAS